MNAIHFKNQKDRLDFLKGNFEEVNRKEYVEKRTLLNWNYFFCVFFLYSTASWEIVASSVNV